MTKTISDILKEKVENETYFIVSQIREDLGISEERMLINVSNSRGGSIYIKTGSAIVTLTREFKIERKLYSAFLDILEGFVGENYCLDIHTHDKENLYFEFTLSLDEYIDINKTILENKKNVLKISAIIDYLCGSFSEIV